MLYIDTNYLVRFFANDIPNLSSKARKVIKNTQVFIPGIIIAETVYILRKFYEVGKLEICSKLAILLRQRNIDAPTYCLLAIEIYKMENVSFYDSLLAAEVIETGNELRTFDEKLQKVFKKYST